MDKKINIGELISIGWNLTLKNFAYLLGLLGLLLVINIIFGLGTEFFKRTGFFSLIGYNLIVAGIGIIMNLGVTKISIGLIDGKKESYKVLYSQYSLTIKYFLANLLTSLVALLPIFIVLSLWAGSRIFSSFFGQAPVMTLNLIFSLLGIVAVITSFIISAKLMFFSYFIVDKNSGVIESIKSSLSVTKGEVLKLILLTIVLILINIAGVLALALGLLITIPLSMLAVAAAYRKLSPASTTTVAQ
jgi:hypothetical protein